MPGINAATTYIPNFTDEPEQEPHDVIRCEDIAHHPAYRSLASLRGVAHDLRYAGSHNFAGKPLYVGLDCAWLRSEAAAGLETAAAWLARERPGFTLLVLDALRPQRVQEAIWADVAGTEMASYFAEPTLGSIHSYGMAVDVTLVDPQGRECDMGSGFDEASALSHPEFEAEHLARGLLSEQHLAARRCLNSAMAQGGFQGIPNEWWHFNHGDPAAVRREQLRVY